MPSERIRASVELQEGVSATTLLGEIRDYALAPRGPWGLISKRPLVLWHSGRAPDVRYTFERADDGGVSVLVRGRDARLGLGYLTTMLGNPRFAELIRAVRIDLNP